ncbi:MAG: hypothetical protein JNM07_12840 [Phycisphaerae bacterium]|nr:hypothetical protein [Phycisphaerae bacterium]
MTARRLITSLTVACLASAALSGCASSGARVAGNPTPQTTAAFERLKSLAGTWEMADEKGQRQTASVFAVTANGSAVREIMFPGMPHEMTNVYHMDGPNLIVTHYCAGGNQPRMKATPADLAADGSMRFGFDSISNLKDATGEYMAELTLKPSGTDKLTQEWNSMKEGKKTEHVVFAMDRKRG